jgi:hypothetical protein
MVPPQITDVSSSYGPSVAKRTAAAFLVAAVYIISALPLQALQGLWGWVFWQGAQPSWPGLWALACGCRALQGAQK